MATRTATCTYGVNGEGRVSQAVWAGLLQSSSDVGSAVDLPGADRTAQLSGTLGTGGAVTLQGSNDGTNWGSLRDPAGNVATLDAVGEVVQISEATRYVRPAVTAGDVATDLTLTLISRRAT